MYKVTVVEGVTFQPKHEIFLDDFPWSRVWNAGHQGSFSFKVSELELQPELHRTNLWPLENWLVVEWNGTPVYAAIITDHAYKRSTRTVTVSYADIWWFWERRNVLSNRTADAANYLYDWQNITYRAMAIKAVKVGIDAEPGSPLSWHLPIVFPSEGSAGTVDRKVYGYSFESVKSLLDEAAKAGDLNIDFRPRWSSYGSLEFVMDINAFGPVLEWDLDAVDTPVVDLDYKVSGSRLANHVFGTGEGSEEDMLVRTSSKPIASPYPALERVISGKSVDTKERLQALVSAERIGHDAMIRQSVLTVRAEGPPSVASFQLGSPVSWRTISDPYVPNIWNQSIVIQISGSLKRDVTLTLAETGG